MTNFSLAKRATGLLLTKARSITINNRNSSAKPASKGPLIEITKNESG